MEVTNLMMKSLNLVTFGLVTSLLVACSSASDISVRNPNYFGAKLNDGVISGVYNPSGFTTQLVQNQIKGICIGSSLGGYNETPVESGLVAFTTSCAQGSDLSRAFVEVERMPSGNFSVEVLGS